MEYATQSLSTTANAERSQHTELMNGLAQRAWACLAVEYPDWKEYFSAIEGEFEVAVPAPKGSKAGHLVIFTDRGNLWVRYSPRYMCYALNDEDEMLRVVEQLLTDRALFVVIMQGDEWVETTLIAREHQLSLANGQVAHVVSWSGTHDRVVATGDSL